MKNEVLLYNKIYEILKNRIDSGLQPSGSKLPSRAELCNEFGISDKTARRAIGMLAENGLIYKCQRKRATVKPNGKIPASLQKADAVFAAEIFSSGVLLCYPLIASGMQRCSQEDWKIPERIYETMNPVEPANFWKRSNLIWRFFIARNGNDISLRAVDSLGLTEIDPLEGTLQVRSRYYETLGAFLKKVKEGENPENFRFEDLSYLYGNSSDREINSPLMVPSESPLFAGSNAIERRFSGAEMRYSSVYMDILGLIAAKRYLPGDRLPAHDELCRIYGVSVDTTIKAISMLREWGAVTAKRGRGIYVAADLEALKAIEFAPELIACHVRRYLDSLELLSQTIEGAAAHAAANAGAEDARNLGAEIADLWENDYVYLLSPTALLSFISGRVKYGALRSIYAVLLKNYHIGRSIPKLVTHTKNDLICRINSMCAEAAKVLESGDVGGFAVMSAEIFRFIHSLVIEECEKHGYLEPAMKVYDGSSLWRS